MTILTNGTKVWEDFAFYRVLIKNIKFWLKLKHKIKWCNIAFYIKDLDSMIHNNF